MPHSEVSDSEAFAFVHNTDYEPPTARLRRPEEDADEVPLKSSIGVAGDSSTVYTLVVNGKETPIYPCALPGFGNLFTTELQQAPAEPNRTPGAQGKTQSNHHIRTSHSKAQAPAARGVKRSRFRARPSVDDGGDDGDDDDEPVAKRNHPQTLYINDIEALKSFYEVRLRELTMKPLRQIVTAWVKEISPKRQATCGPYHKRGHPDNENLPKAPWWPEGIPYYEPSHLKLKYLIPLAVDIMLVHRKMDEEHGKRDKAWIKILRKRAVNSVDLTPDDNFSSSTDPTFNKAMKKRALEQILTSLFDVAETHEDYVTQFGLFEGSGRQDPGYGKTMTWEQAPRLDRSMFRKKPRLESELERAEHAPTWRRESAYDSRDEAERYEIVMDEHMRMPRSSFSSFRSFASDEDTKMVQEATPLPRADSVAPAPIAPIWMNRLHLGKEQGISGMDYTATGYQPIPSNFFPNSMSYYPELGGSMFPGPPLLTMPHLYLPAPEPAAVNYDFMMSVDQDCNGLPYTCL
ncbi:hypothetical protein P280DRAFT_471032 [Massarina eburnea CBS 473.64]|uniref:Subtelomeric hrmA-associated cluster protein AFUB-079030/YDR124W-like helical bundle domain-containing protein n=1 Tax=Massarina eburnea CBS 473.64 TaxID=1395130 RepID=A0A6A6RX63_9PLEO|nr:hypothetical protein P280DRAFT_471032 [Massarina eburnea CBS 473.64]